MQEFTTAYWHKHLENKNFFEQYILKFKDDAKYMVFLDSWTIAEHIDQKWPNR